jgi:two-component system, cell cycle response regulator
MADGDTTRTIPRSPGRDTVGEDRAPAPCLIVIRGLNVGQSVRLGHTELILGRGSQADVDLGDDSVSRRHASVHMEGGRALVTDLGSKTGTFVNGKRIAAPATLADGDKIQVSTGTILKFTMIDRLDETFQRRMYESSLRDPLTQSFNRRYFLDRLERELRFARRHKQPLSLILVDVDNLDEVNERDGTAAGDAVLVELAGRVHGLLRQEDVVARIGGDELAVICRATEAADALAVAERIRATIADRGFAGGHTQVTVAVGVAGLEVTSAPGRDLIAAADTALADAKRAGGNCVRTAS